MNAVIQEIEKSQVIRPKPAFKVGDTVKVHLRIKEGDKERIQVYEGVVSAMKGTGSNMRFTVRKISYGVGVEKSFHYQSPMIKEIKPVRSGKVRRAKLFYLRDKLSKKDTRIREGKGVEVPAEGAAPTAEELVPQLAPEETPEGGEKKAETPAEGAAPAEAPKDSEPKA